MHETSGQLSGLSFYVNLVLIVVMMTPVAAVGPIAVGPIAAVAVAAVGPLAANSHSHRRVAVAAIGVAVAAVAAAVAVRRVIPIGEEP